MSCKDTMCSLNHHFVCLWMQPKTSEKKGHRQRSLCAIWPNQRKQPTNVRQATWYDTWFRMCVWTTIVTVLWCSHLRRLFLQSYMCSLVLGPSLGCEPLPSLLQNDLKTPLRCVSSNTLVLTNALVGKKERHHCLANASAGPPNLYCSPKTSSMQIINIKVDEAARQRSVVDTQIDPQSEQHPLMVAGSASVVCPRREQDRSKL
jgi:hypothetical protein